MTKKVITKKVVSIDIEEIFPRNTDDDLMSIYLSDFIKFFQNKETEILEKKYRDILIRMDWGMSRLDIYGDIEETEAEKATRLAKEKARKEKSEKRRLLKIDKLKKELAELEKND